eukprot:8207750-Pyramimonas_sp.AAC.1
MAPDLLHHLLLGPICVDQIRPVRPAQARRAAGQLAPSICRAKRVVREEEGLRSAASCRHGRLLDDVPTA